MIRTVVVLSLGIVVWWVIRVHTGHKHSKEIDGPETQQIFTDGDLTKGTSL